MSDPYLPPGTSESDVSGGRQRGRQYVEEDDESLYLDRPTVIAHWLRSPSRPSRISRRRATLATVLIGKDSNR
jgi:hypothetical protein